MKSMLKLKFIYEKIIVSPIIYPWFIIIISIIINLMISGFMLYFLRDIQPVNMNTYKHPMMLKLPTIKNIHEYFIDKCNLLTKQYDTTKFYATSNNDYNLFKHSLDLYISVIKTTPDINTGEYVSLKNNHEDFNSLNYKKGDYVPSSDYNSYLPDQNFDLLPLDTQTELPQKNKSSTIQKQPNFENIPIFKVTVDKIEDTVLLGPDIINNDLPFEEIVEITVPPSTPVSNTDDALIAFIMNNSLDTELKACLCDPGYHGPIMLSEDVTYNIYIDIEQKAISYVKSLPHNMSNFEIKNQLRNYAHELLLESHILHNIKHDDLRNFNHPVNL